MGLIDNFRRKKEDIARADKLQRWQNGDKIENRYEIKGLKGGEEESKPPLTDEKINPKITGARTNKGASLGNSGRRSRNPVDMGNHCPAFSRDCNRPLAYL